MPAHRLDPGAVARAAGLIERADALVISAGAGIGVDSGLPDFRGPQGFWRAYPRYRELGLRFEQMANPDWFARDPGMAWGFYGHRRALYRRVEPHSGFARLLEMARARPRGAFVFTSNVDGQFQRAGFEDARVVECHGSIEFEQCAGPLGGGHRGSRAGSTPGCARIWAASGPELRVDAQDMRAAEPWPRCPGCGELARPNILMFGDWQWRADRSEAKLDALARWLEGLELARLVVVEVGAGTAIPTVRDFDARLVQRGAALIRINPREPGADAAVELEAGARVALEAIAASLGAGAPGSAR